MARLLPVFVHGWGFGPEFWQPVLMQLNWPDAVTLDLGFLKPQTTGAEKTVTLDDLRQSQHHILGIGHSLGFMWLMLQRRQGVWPAESRFAGINTFACFASREDFPEGVAPRIVQRMIRGLGREPAAVVNDFRQRCGASSVLAARCQPEALAYGLDILRTEDARADLPLGPLNVLAGRQDEIASPSMTEASFRALAHIKWVENGGHLLPQTHPVECARFLEMLRNRMEQQP
ncbi:MULTISPECIES: alpha/beta fold hydrolase [Acetobacter]|uniref:alpha/beta fold hydrolase n=1 Tax=Acetobacter TaxID=434 RepID=UPI0002D7DA63|nr:MULTISPECIES: alpha/beta hydrolase [Acetobacter]ATI11332.1 alpha/beta hydrolase [Acetobacter pomorum]AXC26330.1 alpha/beta fold hydrolase [Acetobacter sp. JWB]KAA8428115.1 alpha/beta fold hydrolase [Acetobacter pomorum]KAA8437146.1 alpha/beta fold hydrolase [Acetobacter pomorum]KAA8453483.1 alpha/beta fold hydrolase [Acetobacter pomorum]